MYLLGTGREEKCDVNPLVSICFEIHEYETDPTDLTFIHNLVFVFSSAIPNSYSEYCKPVSISKSA